MEHVKSKLIPPPSVVLSMPKVFGLEAVIDALAGKRSAAEAALADAESAYRRAALDEQKGAPGSAMRRSEAAAAVRAAQERVNDVLAAQVEADAERRENALRERVAKEEALEADALRAGEEYAAAIEKWIELSPEIGKVWAGIMDAERRFIRGVQNCTPRMRSSYDMISYIGGMVLLEVARTARVRPSDNSHTPDLPPGLPAPQGASTAKPLSDHVAGIRKCLAADIAKAAAERAKARK
jgi:hypothetical protein